MNWCGSRDECRQDAVTTVRRVAVAIGFLVMAPIVAHGQAHRDARPDPWPRFESTRVERAQLGETGLSFNYRAGRFTATNVTLRTLIRTAYNVAESLISDGPSWVQTDRFHVTAVGDVGASPAPMVIQSTGPSRLQLMLRALLADHFKLITHTERRTARAYALHLGPGGQLGRGLRASAANCAAFVVGVRDPSAPESPPPPPARDCYLSRNSGVIRIGGRPLMQLVSALSAVLGRPVVDHTGLAGNFDIHLEGLPHAASSGVGMSATDLDRIRAATREQLGLLLTLQDQTIDVTVIDHAERPM